MRAEDWALYAFFVEPVANVAVVKIGITSQPLARFGQIDQGSPFPMRVALWTWAGRRSVAQSIEARIHKLFAERRTRGEWFRFDMRDAADKEEFHSTVRKLWHQKTGRQLTWRKSLPNEVVDFCRLYAVRSKAECSLGERPLNWNAKLARDAL